jgi:hypothetical protein
VSHSTESRNVAVAGAFLTRVTQESRSLTQRNGGPAPDHHAGIMDEKSSESLQCSTLWNLDTDIFNISHNDNSGITFWYRSYSYCDQLRDIT